MLYKLRDNNIVPFVGAFTSLTGFLTGAAGLALTIATFWRGMSYLERRVEGLSHQWGPAIYLVGIGSGCILVTLVCFFMSLFSSDSDDHKRDTYRLYDYDLNSTSNHNSNSGNYDSATVPLTSKDNYGYSNSVSTPPPNENYGYGNAVSSPTHQNYPSYHQNQNSYNNYNNSNYY